MQTELSDLFQSNLPPNESQISQILDICSSSASELDHLNSEIHRLQQSLASVTAQRDDLQSKISTYQILLSPLRQFPTEILQQIFQLTLNPFPVIAADEGPLVLGRVCSRWRSICLSTPELWNAVHITVPEALHTFQDYSAKCSRLTLGLSTWLSKAKSLPLYLSVFSKNENTYQEDVIQVSTMLQILVPYASQWKYISLQVPASCLRVFSSLSGADVPVLETARISCSDTNPFILGPDFRHPPFLESAPSLRRLNLGDAGPSFHPVVPWSQLQFLLLDHNDWDFGPDELMDILAQCLSLRDCTLHMHARDTIVSRRSRRRSATPTTPTTAGPAAATSSENDDEHDFTIALPHLEKFYLNTSSIVMSAILDQLALPRLRHLHLDGYRANLSSSLCDSLASLLCRSGTYPLRSIKLELRRTAELKNAKIVEMLRAMPGLRVLAVKEGSTSPLSVIDEEFLNALTVGHIPNSNPNMTVGDGDGLAAGEDAMGGERELGWRCFVRNSRSGVFRIGSPLASFQSISISTFRPGLSHRFRRLFGTATETVEEEVNQGDGRKQAVIKISQDIRTEVVLQPVDRPRGP
ncbi:hypothetical protein D9757_013187 [Collybiopsis confluens]|uniref:F-box domain-containing protein n=1 Tax=Collybiopsis confluens TaxID=2823264 RepID=A0A8H5D517_9AGAR|nr:hypothetical protein D9757_013187 [Collybiopsis confluens]